MLISIAVILIGLIGTHLYLKSKYDVSNKLAELNHSYISGEESEFLSYFEVPEKTAVNASGFYSFIEEEGWEEIRDQMKTEAARIKEEGLSNIILDSEGNKLISITKKPVILGMYQEVSFLLQPTAVEMELPFDGMTVTLADKTVKGDKGEVIKIGDFLPGQYQWSASVASEYGEIAQKGTIDVTGDSKNKYSYSPDIEASIVDVTSDVPEAILWVNGKSTKTAIADLKSIGPLPLNGTVEVTAETENDKGEKIKGEPTKVESDTVHVQFSHIQEKMAAERTQEIEAHKQQLLKEEHEYSVSAYVDSFRISFESALNNADFSYIEDYFPTGSKIQEDYLADIHRHYTMGTYYYYSFQSNTITNFRVIDETTFVVTTAEMFYFDSSQDRLKYNKTKAYTVIYENGQYYIQEIDQLTSEKVPM
ncbi:TcaA 3rd/4th domain-containing protein [Planococcus sp. 1R117A]|uniref:TcaA 3rd/4th domain-containing protein n=1 Tax=Planococcus sp. 1R117A TaxID=3447020 RepID=UPI003EDC6665